MRQRGFTLVELVLVMVLVGILAVYAAPRLGGGYDVAAARDELIEALRYAQQQSMSNTGAANFAVVLAGDGFAIQQGGVTVSDPAGGAYSRQWNGIAVAPAGTVITFGSRGDTNNTVTMTLTGGGDTANVTVEAQTGYVR